MGERVDKVKRFLRIARTQQPKPVARDYLTAHREETKEPYNQLTAGSISLRLENNVRELTEKNNNTPINFVRIFDDVRKLDQMGITVDPAALTELRKVGAIPAVSDTYTQHLEAANASGESAKVIGLVRTGVVLGYAEDPKRDDLFRKLVEDHTALIEESKKPSPEWLTAKTQFEQKWDDLVTTGIVQTGPQPAYVKGRFTAGMNLIHSGILATPPIEDVALLAAIEVMIPRVWTDLTVLNGDPQKVKFFRRYPILPPTGSQQPTVASGLTEITKIMTVPEHLRKQGTHTMDEVKDIKKIGARLLRILHSDSTMHHIRNFDPNLADSRKEMMTAFIEAGKAVRRLRGSRPIPTP